MSRPKRSRRRVSPSGRGPRLASRASLVVAFLILALGIAVGIWWAQAPRRPDLEALREPPSEADPETRPAGDDPGVARPAADPPPPSTPPAPAVPSGPEPIGTIALVVDDLGRSLRDVEVLVDLGIPLTYAVLPYESRTAEVVADLRRRGVEIFLHLPMEAEGGENPGPGALLLAMGPGELQEATRTALAAVPGAIGVNNHMGSGMSAEPTAMRPVLEVVSEQGLAFLDSRTSPRTVASAEARRLGIRTGDRDVFLDAERDPDFIRGQWERLLELARDRGTAIAIAHPHPQTLAALADLVPAARREGYEFVPASALLDLSAPAVVPGR